MSICRDPAMDGRFSIESDVCYAKKAMDEHTGDKTYKPSPGEVIYPVPEEASETATNYGANPFATE